MAVKNIFKKIASGASKAASKASSKAKKAYKAATKKKKVITKKQYTQRGSTTGRKSKYGTKGSSKGWAAFNKTQGGKTAGKGTKGGKKSILDKNINPFKALINPFKPVGKYAMEGVLAESSYQIIKNMADSRQSEDIDYMSGVFDVMIAGLFGGVLGTLPMANTF